MHDFLQCDPLPTRLTEGPRGSHVPGACGYASGFSVSPPAMGLGGLCTISRFWTILLNLHRYKLINSMLTFGLLCKAGWGREKDVV
jgi:hypothetical protein